jgi:hypothetical protein
VTKHARIFVTVLLCAAICPSLAAAQAAPERPAQPPPQAQAAERAPMIPLQVDLVISRYQGDKKISSLPYTLSVTANSREKTSLRMGAEVPVAVSSKEGGAFNYRNVGVGIDCSATTTNDDRYRVELTIDDSSVYDDQRQGAPSSEHPSFRSFRTTQVLLLRAGQSTQFMSATDKVTGEVTKVDVSLALAK